MTDEKIYIFIAGGIGITPFRSMIQDLVLRKEKRRITLLYQAKNENEFLFKDIFTKAQAIIGLDVRYVLSDRDPISKSTIIALLRYQSSMYFLSGPQSFVESKRDMLMEMGIPIEQIKTDLFTGYT